MKIAFVSDTFGRPLPKVFLTYDYMVTEWLERAEEDGRYDEFFDTFPLLFQMQRQAANEKVLTETLYRVMGDISMLSGEQEIAVSRDESVFNDALRRVAQERGYTVVDV